MPSPVGHLIAGQAVYAAMRKSTGEEGLYLWICTLFSALVPDLDFLPGFVLGDPGRFHHGVSHSLGAAVVVYGIGAWGLLRLRGVCDAFSLASLLACAYASHVILDLLAIDTGSPFGVPLLCLSPIRITLLLSLCSWTSSDSKETRIYF